MKTLVEDARYGLRLLWKSPAFTMVAVLTLSLGIGANTAIFSVVNGVLLRSLPYPESDRIVQICISYKGEVDYSSFTAREFEYWKAHSEPFSSLAARTGVGVNLAGGSESVRVRAHRVSSTYFNVLGVPPVFGRNFSADEDTPGGPNVTILSHDLWKTQFGGDPDLVGRNVLLDGASYAVIGVMPAEFRSLPPADVWTTIAQANSSTGSGRNYTVVGRLKKGISADQADSYLSLAKDSFISLFRRDLAKYREAFAFRSMPLAYMLSVDYRLPLLVLFASIGFVLLIACVNLANLFMARTATRRREFAMRAALGASKWRLFSQLLTETALLGLAGGVLGLMFAYSGLSFLLSLAPADLPRLQEISLDARSLWFTGLISLLCGILFGIAPAVQSSRTNLNESLKQDGGRGNTGSDRQRLRGALVIGEVALSFVLLAGASLLIQTFANLLRTNPGFQPNHILSVQIWPTGEKISSTEALANFDRQVIEKMEAIPGVQSAAIVTGGPPLEGGGNEYFQFLGGKAGEGISADYRQITPQYFRTLGVPLLRGRTFTGTDSAHSNGVAIISRAMMQASYSGQNPIGEHLRVEGRDFEIVGVAGDIRSAITELAPPTVFVPEAQADIDVTRAFVGWYPSSILVRTALNPSILDKSIVNAVHSADPSVPIGNIRSMDEVLSTSVSFQRFLMTLMSLFAGLALVLAMLGVYGILAYFVAQRTNEIGVRMALGALRSDVLRMVVRRGMLLTVSGLIAGLFGALVLTRFLARQLYGITAADPRVLILVVLALGFIASLACYLPALRASRVDPMVALRYD